MKFDELYNLLSEAEVLPVRSKLPYRNPYPSDYEPLAGDKTIRVYHGFRDMVDAIRTVKYGLSGKERSSRVYSYEANNNPKGLFISLSLDTAKEFGECVIEFHTKLSDLEAPVWPGGGYTVQGQMSQYFSDADDRESYRAKRIEDLKNHKLPVISKSDRPDLAETLFNNIENQALFIGELNPNSIRAVWINPTPEKSSRFSNFKRLSRKQFLKLYGDKDKIIKNDYRGRRLVDDDTPLKGRILKPRDEFHMDEFLTKLQNKFPQGGSMEEDKKELLEILSNVDDSTLLQYLWPKQLVEFKKERNIK